MQDVLREEPLSLFQILGPQSSTCGYCSPAGQRSKTKSSKSFGLWAHQLSCRTYKQLIDRGWRRSGSYLYKPDMRATCCNQYTIRLQASAFKPSKSQRSIVNRFNTFINEGGKEGQPGYGPPASHAETSRDGAVNAQAFPNAQKGKQKGKNAQAFDLKQALHSAEGHAGAAHDFLVSIEAASYTEEKFRLYKKYQIQIHGDKESKLTDTSFRRFLCDSPLKLEKSPSKDQSYGSFHQMYRIDGILVAIGVLDILPGAVSGVYFLYDPDWSALSLGKISALRECALAEELQLAGFPDMFYMMGYYIHSCQKMRYKGEYSPSFLLDPETYEFLPFDTVCKPLLDQDNHAIFSEYMKDGSVQAIEEVGTSTNRQKLESSEEATAKSSEGVGQVDSDDEEEEEEEAEEQLSVPPPPGFLDPTDLPFDLLKSVYSFEKGQVMPLIVSRSWRFAPEKQRKLREGIAALGVAAEETCLFV